MKKTYPLILIGLAILGGCIFYVASRAASQRGAAVAQSSTPAAEQVPSAIPASTASSSIRAPERTKPDGTRNHAVAADVESYLAQLPDAGNGSVALARAHAIDECAAARNRPNYVAELIERHKRATVPKLDTVARYATITVERCKKFNTGSRSGLKDLEDLYSQAENEGNPAAKARNLARDVLMSAATPQGAIAAADLQPVVIDLLSSGDPDIILAMSDLMGEMSKLKGAAAGTTVAEAAWELVACDFGMDCSYGSALLRGFCLNGSVYCGSGDLRANMMNSGFSPEAYARVLELERLIYRAMREGNVASLFDTPD